MSFNLNSIPVFRCVSLQLHIDPLSEIWSQTGMECMMGSSLIYRRANTQRRRVAHTHIHTLEQYCEETLADTGRACKHRIESRKEVWTQDLPAVRRPPGEPPLGQGNQAVKRPSKFGFRIAAQRLTRTHKVVLHERFCPYVTNAAISKTRAGKS